MGRKGAAECFSSKPAATTGWIKSGLQGVIRRHSCTNPKPQIYIPPNHRFPRAVPKSSRTRIQVLEKPEAFVWVYKTY